MSDFVNYGKRSVTLPLGCKNLAEVLARKSLSRCAEWKGQKHLKCEKLSAIGEYISRAWDSTAEDVVPTVTAGKPADLSQKSGLCFTLYRMPGDGLTASVRVRMGSENETALRLFLERHNYPQPDTSIPVQFNPDLPIEIFWTVSPFPSQAGELTALATAVFRPVSKLDDESQVTVFYQEQPS